MILRCPLRPATAILAAWLLCGGWLANVWHAVAAEEVSESGMKAVLFYRLAKFIYWPEGESSPKNPTYCVVGKTTLSAALEQLRQAGDVLELRLSPTDLTACQLLFIGRSEAAQIDSWLARTEGKKIVTVSDIPGFARAGGMIELPLEGERVGIVINRGSASRKGIEFNAQLLRLARVINQ